MQHNQHKRLAKRILPRFDPTWLGDPTSTASVPGITAVAPPVAVTPTFVEFPTTSPTPVVITPTPEPTTQQVQVTTPPVTTPIASVPVVTQSSVPVSVVVVTSSIQSVVVPSSVVPVVVSSSTPVQSVAQQASTPAVSNAVVPTTTKASSTRAVAAPSNVVGTSFVGISASASPTASAAATPSNTGTVVGAIAGSLVGIVCLIAFVSWIIRKHAKSKQNDDDFDRPSYLRNSMMIPDNDPAANRPVIGTQAALALARANNQGGPPRPPTMIERKPTYLMHNGQPSPSFGPGQVVSFEPGQVVSAPPTADVNGYPSPMAFAGYTPPGQQMQSELSRRPSGAQLLTRQPTNGGMYDNNGYAYPSAGGMSPGGMSPGGMSPGGHYAQDPFTYPMHPPSMAERGMVQSVTPYQAQQYAELTRALEGDPAAFGNDSFLAISPADQSPLSAPTGYAFGGDDADSTVVGSMHTGDKYMPNPFEGEPQARINSTPPSLPPLGIAEGLSRTGTPIDPNPQHAHWSYDAKAGQEGSRLSVAGMPVPVTNAPTMPPAAYTREERTVVVGNGEAMPAKRPVSIVDEDDVYGGM